MTNLKDLHTMVCCVFLSAFISGVAIEATELFLEKDANYNPCDNWQLTLPVGVIPQCN